MKVMFTDKKPKTITDLRHLVKSSAEVFGDRVLYTYKHRKVQYTYTYNDLYRNMNYVGTAFSKLGISKGHIVVIGETHPLWVTTYFAVVNGGGVIVPMDKELSIEELVKFINISEACAIVYTESFNKKLIDYKDQLPNVKYFIPIVSDSEDEDEKVFPYEEILKLGKEELENGNLDYVNHEIDMNKMCSLLFTSGTTGTSKGVMLSQYNLTCATNSACASMKYGDQNTFVSVLPIHHSYEMTCAHFGMINIGGETFINDSLKYVTKNFAQFRPNTLVLVPLFLETMHKKIWDEIDKKGLTKKVKTAIKLSNAMRKVGIDMRDKFFSQVLDAFGGNLTSIVCGGAPLSPQIIKDFDSFGITILEGYGITECSPLIAVNRPGSIVWGSVGNPVENCEVKIDNPAEDGTGEILAKGGNVMLGYYKNPEATAEVFTDDGWFRTGDIGKIDKNGIIYITGRKKNVIILSNGKNIFPEEIEEYISESSLIKESVVVGRKKSDSQEIVITAIVYPDYDKFIDKSPDEINVEIKNEINRINRNLPVFKQIRDFEIREVEFEKTTSKKIKRYKVV